MPDTITPQLTAEQTLIHQRIKEDRDDSVATTGLSWKDIRIFRNYARGLHNSTLTDKQREILRNLLGNRFCDNICHQIVAEATGRIEFKGWECKNESVKKWLDTFYRMARVKNRQEDVHYRTLRDGNFVLAVNWDKKRNRIQIYKEDWWDGNSGIYVQYDSSDEPEYAVKEWTQLRRVDNGQSYTTVKIRKRTVWFDDRIERYESIAEGVDSGWKRAPLETDVLSPEDVGVSDPIWPMPWVDENGDPLGIPYVHFLNAAKTEGNHGLSELDGGVTGFQDQINDAQYNLSINVRFTGSQQYYATGVKPKNKEGTSEPLPVKMEPGMMHTSPNEKSQFGVLQAGNPDAILSSYNTKLKAVSRMTSTPLHSITGGDWPSGDALLRAELPAVNKARKQINQFEDCWTEVAVLAMKIHNVFRPNKEAKINYDIKDGIVEPKFSDPEKRDAISRSIIVHNIGDKISDREALRIMEYSEQRAQEIYDEKVEEETNSAEALASTLATRGVPGSGVTRPNASNSGGNNKPDARPA